MLVVNNVSDAVLEQSLPDDEMISIQTSDMTFTLGRHTPAKLAGFQIESGDGKFMLPAESGVLDSQIANSTFLDTQVKRIWNYIPLKEQLIQLDIFVPDGL